MPYQYDIKHRSDYNELRRNQMGLISADESQIFWRVRRSSGVSLGAVGGGGWVGPCMLRLPQNFDSTSRSAIVCSMAES